MGICTSRGDDDTQSKPKKFKRIADKYKDNEEVKNELRRSGLENCQLIVGIDFTKSNTWTGTRSYKGKCLHAFEATPNPYNRALTAIANTLEDFDDDNSIPSYGFGDSTTRGHSVFSFHPNRKPSEGLTELMHTYEILGKSVKLSGPTTFAPLITQAMKDVVQNNMNFHLLLIIADGNVSVECLADTEAAIVEACAVPMPIVVVGVGDGPWEEMKRFDDGLPKRTWDNFQFVQFDLIYRNPDVESDEMRAAQFALRTLMELPEQYKICANLIGNLSKGKEVLKKLEDTNIPEVKNPPYGLPSSNELPSTKKDSEALIDDFAKVFSP